MPSLVAEIGDVIHNHLVMIGMISEPTLDSNQQEFLNQKRAQLEEAAETAADEESGSFPPEAKLCSKCRTKAVIQMDNCLTCLNCGDSKCG